MSNLRKTIAAATVLGTAAVGLAIYLARTEPAVAVAPVVHVYKGASCTCCTAWEAHLRDAGFQVESHSQRDMRPVKTRLRIPANLQSCHTASVGGYVIEGHVPAADIVRLLEARPEARGLAVPGMPMGSPGMEQGDRRDAYDVVLFSDNDERQTFASH